MKYLLSLLLVFALFSCETKEEVQSDVDQLKHMRQDLQDEIIKGQRLALDYIDDIKKDRDTLTEVKYETLGKQPLYIVRFKLKQSHVSLDIGTHMKDAANAIEFEMAVDKDFYHKLTVGSKVVDEFRMGSAVLYGSWGSWNMTVLEKHIDKR